MAKTSSKKTQAMRHFQAAFKKWFECEGISQIEASAYCDVSPALINKILKGKASLSLAVAERIAWEIGRGLPELLLEGRTLLAAEGENTGLGQWAREAQNPHPPASVSGQDKESRELKYVAALRTFQLLMRQGGEGADFIAATLNLAAKRIDVHAVGGDD
jgi:transcriptional regulator with XRE-family HTH domain